MPKPGDVIHIPLSEREALAGMLKVKPTTEMPRPGAQAMKAKGKTKPSVKARKDKKP